MTTTLNPMLEDLEIFKPYSPTEKRLKKRLRDFLSRPEVIALQDPGTAAAMRVLLEELLWLANNLDRASSSIWIMRACDTLCSAAHAKRKAEKEAHP